MEYDRITWPLITILAGAWLLAACNAAALAPKNHDPAFTTAWPSEIAPKPTATLAPDGYMTPLFAYDQNGLIDPLEFEDLEINTPLPPTVTPVPYGLLAPRFGYDQNSPLDLQQSDVINEDGLQVQDLSYASSTGGRVKAFLVTPKGSGPYPGVLFLHPLGGDRSSFLGEAKRLAKQGFVGLSIDGSFTPSGKAEDQEQIIHIIVDMQRGVDLLSKLPSVNPQRIGFIGMHDGAALGSVLSGVEKRIEAYVLISGFARKSRDLAGKFVMDESQETQYLGLIGQWDSITFIGHAAPAALFFQNALRDEYTPRQEALDLQAAGSEPKLIRWYDAYSMLNDQAEHERVNWLIQQLKQQ